MTNQKKILKLGEKTEIQVVAIPKGDNQKTEHRVYFLAQATELGFSIAIPISLGALFGVWLDSKFNSHPKLTLSFLLGGIFLAFLSLVHVVTTFSKKGKSQTK